MVRTESFIFVFSKFCSSGNRSAGNGLAGGGGGFIFLCWGCGHGGCGERGDLVAVDLILGLIRVCEQRERF